MPEVKLKHLEDLSIQESETKKWLNQFEKVADEERSPRGIRGTLPLSDGFDEQVHYVNPFKVPTKQITWDYIRDIQAYWSNKSPTLWVILFVGASGLLMIFWQFYKYARWF